VVPSISRVGAASRNPRQYLKIARACACVALKQRTCPISPGDSRCSWKQAANTAREEATRDLPDLRPPITPQLGDGLLWRLSGAGNSRKEGCLAFGQRQAINRLQDRKSRLPCCGIAKTGAEQFAVEDGFVTVKPTLLPSTSSIQSREPSRRQRCARKSWFSLLHLDRETVWIGIDFDPPINANRSLHMARVELGGAAAVREQEFKNIISI
jgi:hypothetical protein